LRPTALRGFFVRSPGIPSAAFPRISNLKAMKSKRSPRASSSDLFSPARRQELFKSAPLSVRMRPADLTEYVGQRHILGPGKLLTRAIQADRIGSLVLYGPPGSGKTTLAYCISRKTQSVFERINAVSSNTEEMRAVIAASRHRRMATGRKTILFIDEIHRFNKAQQDVLMPDLEEGHLVLVGATVFNPFFSLLSPLLSRSLVFELFPLSPQDIVVLLERALSDKERGLGQMPIQAQPAALTFLADACNGDARRALNALEIGCLTIPPKTQGRLVFDISVAQECIQKKQVQYDRAGDAHYDTASAFIKSMRGSDPDAALYWLAKMLYAGEDPRFIARRICICAAEDVGNADPQALILANAALQVSEFIGLPEARIPLAQATTYIACAPKSNAAYMGLEKATRDIVQKKIKEVPVHLKDASYAGARKLGHGQEYKYAHNYANHYVEQVYVPDAVGYYTPGTEGYEKVMRDYLERIKSHKK